MLHRACIGFGSNLGDRSATIRAAADELRAAPGVQSVRRSSMHETDPVGGPPGQPAYLNAAAVVETTLSPRELLDRLLEIERQLGRQRRERWGPRTIDLDLLLYDDRVIDEPGLTVPHPRMHERRFVLEPLVEIAPDMIHPVLRATVRELFDRLAAGTDWRHEVE